MPGTRSPLLNTAETPATAPTLPPSGRRIEGPASARLQIDGREYINFFGSGYLALTQLPALRKAAIAAIESGVAFARQVPPQLGTQPIFDDLERLAAAAIGAEASVYFASGYFIGLVGLASVADSFDLILIDESAHYCLMDGAKLTGLPIYQYTHCSTEALATELRHRVGKAQRPLIVTDGVFATTGRVPPLNEYARLIAPYDGRFFIDESHGFGVVGATGRGGAEYHGVEPLAMSGATLSKAFCAQGGFLGCSAEAVARLRALPVLRGACSGSPISAAIASASLRYVAEHPDMRAQLRSLTDYCRTRLRGVGMDVIDSPAPIVAFQYGARRDMQALRDRLLERGIYIYHSSYVGAGDEGMIRCAIFRDHSKTDIDALVDTM